jgi:translocation and assembly module TamB
MTDNSPTSSHGLKFFLQTGSAIALGLFCLGIIGVEFGRWWAKHNLSPILEQELAKSLKRPIKIGQIEEVSLNSFHVRNVSIPASGDELNRLQIGEIIVDFNLLQLAIDRSIQLNIRVVAPNIYLAQNAAGSWGKIPPQDKPVDNAIKVKVGTVKIDNGIITIVPYSQTPQPVELSKINIQANIDDAQAHVDFKANAQAGANGKLQIEGKSLVATGATQVAVSGEKLDAAAATRVVKIPEVTIDRGTVDGNLSLAIQPGKYLKIASNLLVHDGKVRISNVPRSLDAINGKIQVSEHDVKFDNVSTKYDRVSGLVSGSLDFLDGYRLQAKTTPVSLPDLVKSIDVVSPFALAGAATADLELTGKLDAPILSGKFVNTQISQVDRVQFDRVDGNFKLADGRIKLQAILQPKLGGKVTTQGEIELLKTPVVRFGFRGENLPGDSLSLLYGAKLPPQFKIGATQVEGTVVGAAERIYTNVRAVAPQASYPLTTDVQIDPQGNLAIRDARIAVAGGSVRATGKVTRTNWDVSLQSSGLDTQQLAKISGASLPIGYGGKLAGSIQAQGLNSNLAIDAIQARGRLGLQLAAGRIDSNSFTIDRGRWQANVNTNNLNLQQLDRTLPVGVVSGNFNVGGNSLKRINPNTIFARGGGKVALKGGEIRATNLNIGNGNWQGIFTTNDFQLATLNPQVDGKLTGKFNLAGNLQKFTPTSIRGIGSGTVNLANGRIDGNNLAIDRGKWRGDVRLSSLAVGGLVPNIPKQFRTAKVDGNLQVAGDLEHLDPNHISLTGDGKLSWLGGVVVGKSIDIKAGKWRGDFAVDRLKLGNISEAIPSNFASAQLRANFSAAGDLAKLTPDRIQVLGSGELSLADGKIRFDRAELNRGNLQTVLDIDRLKLGTINNKLPSQLQGGILAGKFNVAGNINRLTPTGIQANGSGKLSNIFGGNIRLANVNLNDGIWGAKVSTDRLKIKDLAKFAPPNNITSQINGEIGGDLQLAGNVRDSNLANIQVWGKPTLTNLQAGGLTFDRTLIGNIQANPGQGVDISFTGTSDRLSFKLDRNLQPQNFSIEQQGIVASGKITNREVNVNLQQFPIVLLKEFIPKSAGIQAYRMSGIATGNLAVNLANFEVTGKQIEINRPTFGAFEGDLLLANFRYSNGQLSINNTEIQRGKHTYLITANASPLAKTPTFKAKIQIPAGSLEDIRDLVQVFGVNDLVTPLNQRKYGTVKDLEPNKKEIAYRSPNITTELLRLSELRRWLNRETDKQSTSTEIPDLRDLHGDISGTIEIGSNPQAGISADFNIMGKSWQLQRYNLDRIQVAGNWRNNRLHLAPMNLTIKDSELTIAGDFEATNQKANVTLKNLPAESLTSIIKIPVDVTGSIDLNAQISGNLFNPHISGGVALNNGQMNQTKLEYAVGTFNYWDGRLNFDSNANFDALRATESSPIRINGSIPYQLPFSLKPPATNAIRVDVTLQDRGLQILDVMSKKQLHWIDGKGKIALNINGELKPEGGFESLSANGTATINNGSIQSVALPEPLRNINGEIIFDFDRVDVKKLDGTFANGSSSSKNNGQVSIAGIIPISNSVFIDPNQRLNVSMTGIAIDLPTKYKGNMDGKIAILGTALNPALTGELKLSNGKVFIPESANTTDTILGVNTAPDIPTPNPLQLRDLSLILADNVQIVRPPILSFLATGKLTINGTPDDLKPFGQVQLQKGSLDLFTTQFRLASGYPQTADFFPNLGTEPVLNLRLYAKTLESTANTLSQGNSITRTAKGSEINETNDLYGSSLGSVQTIQVEAKVSGLASQLTQRLELTSTPSRTQPEILFLLGGGLIQQLESGNSNIGLGIVNLAGSGLLNNIQDKVSEAFNLPDVRLFPTITKEAKSNNTSTLGIAAEIGTDITPKISASVFKILTNTESFQYSLRYRINDQTIIRGSTNLFGENRAILEFERRF